MAVNEKNIFDIMAEYSVNEGLNDCIINNDEYLKIQNKINEQSEQFDKLSLSKEQRLIVDRLISSHIESGAFYGKMTYKQGFIDCVSLLQEINLIKVL